MRGTPKGPDSSLGRYWGMPPLTLRDLASLATAVVETGRPGEGRAGAPPSERSIRFYISRGCVDKPVGRGATASYGYRHLLQVLFVRASQDAGRSLEDVARVAGGSDEVLLAVVDSWLGGRAPAPGDLLPALGARSAHPAPDGTAPAEAPGLVRKVVIEDGCEMLVDVTHPVFRLSAARRAQVRVEVAAAIHRVMAAEGSHAPQV